MTTRIITGDAREVLPLLDAGSVHCCVTSPPYYGLRDYGVAGQIGLEPSPDEYVEEMVDVFREVRRVLRDDGTLWLNLGDSYATRGGSNTTPQMGALFADRKRGTDVVCKSKRLPRGTGRWGGGNVGAREGIKPKDLLGIPWMVAFALRADGWYLRSAIVWDKPNPMPESCTDRPTSSYELVFLLSKSAQYFYDAEAIREESTSDHSSGNGFKRPAAVTKQNPDGTPRGNDKQWTDIGGTRNARNVWRINTQPFAGSHFATMPPDLAEQCIKAGTSEGGACPTCGVPLERVVEKGEPDIERQRACGGDRAGEYHGASTKDHAAAGVQDASAVKARILAGTVKRRTVGWRPTCACAPGKPVPCTVLDPFGGAGTTGLVADRLKRNAALIELNPEYAEMAAKRIRGDATLFAEVAA